jgi:hypothetical protein
MNGLYYVEECPKMRILPLIGTLMWHFQIGEGLSKIACFH